MRVLFYGSKKFKDLKRFHKVVDQSGFLVDTVIAQLGQGVTELAEQWAARNEVSIFTIPCSAMTSPQIYSFVDAAIIIAEKENRIICRIRENLTRLRKPYFLVLEPENLWRKDYERKKEDWRDYL